MLGSCDETEKGFYFFPWIILLSESDWFGVIVYELHFVLPGLCFNALRAVCIQIALKDTWEPFGIIDGTFESKVLLLNEDLNLCLFLMQSYCMISENL